MRISLSAALLLCFLVASAQRISLSRDLDSATPDQSWERQQEWLLTHDIDGGFSVTSPGPLHKVVDTFQTEVGELVHTTHFLETPIDQAQNAYYMITYVDYPEGSLHHDSTELVSAFFDASQEEAVAAIKGELRFSTELNKQDYPGRHWRIDYLGGEAGIRTQVYVAGRRFYQIQTVSLTDKGLSDATEDFFASFRIY